MRSVVTGDLAMVASLLPISLTSRYRVQVKHHHSQTPCQQLTGPSAVRHPASGCLVSGAEQGRGLPAEAAGGGGESGAPVEGLHPAGEGQ